MSEIENIEGMILHGLLFNDDYSQKVLPFVKTDYFQTSEYGVIFDELYQYTTKYNKAPLPEALIICLQQNKKLSSGAFTAAEEILQDFAKTKDKKIDIDWLSDNTEKWCQDSAFYNVLIEASDVVDGDKNNVSKFGMPDKMSEALSISFDTSIGHDYFEDASARYKLWHEKSNKIPFDIEMFNRITKGGQPPKTLAVLMSSKTGGFKSGTMCHFSASDLMSGRNVLYITLELAEEVVAERIDANLLGVDLDDLELMSESAFMKAVDKNKQKTKGKLVIKEYPTSSAHSGHFRFLLKELKMKHGFVPDKIYIDYINICTSARLPTSAVSNSYLYVKTIAEELRGLAVEFNVPIMSATQSGRQAATANDVGIDDISESYGLTHVVDLLLGVITTPELDEMNQILFKQLKNRFGDINKNNIFPVGVNKAQMRLFDAENTSGQPVTEKKIEKIDTGGYKIVDVLEGDSSIEDNETLGYSSGSQSKRKKFSNFKV